MSKKQSSRRQAVVFFSLAGVLAATTGLLVALSPAPLTPGMTLLNTETSAGLDAIFELPAPPDAGRWTAIYVRHTATPAGNAYTDADPAAGPGDHFTIGNGHGAGDGEIQLCQRWTRQSPALPPPGATTLDPRWISISVVGDFDKTRPTEAQSRHLADLLATLQARLNIPADRVFFRTDLPSAVGVGKHFPEAEIRSGLLLQ